MYVHFQQILNLLCSYYHTRFNERHRQCTDDISGWFETSLNIFQMFVGKTVSLNAGK